MAIDSHYIPAFSIEDVLLDKDTGAPLTGGLVYFEKDDQRGILKPVYQITGTSPNYSYIQLPNPMTLSAIGTFEDALDNPTIPYFYPYDANGDVELYYVRVTSAEGVEQFTREAVPYVPTSGDSVVTSALENEISNPQFAEVLFDSPSTFTFNGVTDEVIIIAPGWDVVLTSPGVGSLTLSVVTPTGSLNRITNPGTMLNINSTGLSKLRLRQRLYGSPNLWGSGYLAATFIAKTYAGTSSVLNMYYSQSDGTVVDELLSSATLTSDGVYAAYPGSALIPASTSTESFPDAYVEIYFDIPLSTEIDISSIMVAFTNNISVNNIIYDQTSFDRQVDNLFHYYKPQLEYKPIPSYAIGWDFPFNPGQALGTTITATALGANKSRYIADQTIAFEAVSNVLSYTLSSPNGLSIFTTGTTQFALVQYLDQITAREMLAQRLSVMLRGITNSGTLSGTVSLYWTTDGSLPNVASGTNNSLVATMTSGKAATFNGTWTEVTRGGLGNATFTLTNDYQNIMLTGFDATAGAGFSLATFFAIVVGFDAMPSTQTAGIEFVTLQAGDIATPPAPLSSSQTLQALQAYYESSYTIGTIPGTITAQSQLVALQNGIITGGNISLYPCPFGFQYMTPKRTTASVNLFSPDTGLGDTVRGHLYTNGVARNEFDVSLSANWSIDGGTNGLYFIPLNATAEGTTGAVSTTNPVANLTFQYVADARFGIV